MSLNNWITVIGMILALVSIIKWVKEKKSWVYNIVILVLGVGLIILSVRKNNIDESNEVEQAKTNSMNNKKIDSLQNGMKILITKSIKDDEFQKYLREKPFNIIRDSATNKPVKDFHTNIGTARDVYIGNN